MQLIRFSLIGRFAWVTALALVGGACAPSDPGSATGGRSGATGGAGVPGSGGATGGSTNVGTGGGATATGGTDATGGAETGGSTSPGTGGAATSTGGSDAGGGTGGRGQSTGGAAGGMSNGGTSGGGCGSAAFCDDFERTMLGTDWMLDAKTTANSIEISTTQHHSGTSSVHIKFGTGAMANYVDSAKGFPFPNDAFWGRVWLYAMTGLESGHHVYIEAQSGATNSMGVRVLNTQKMTFIATNLQVGDSGGVSAVTMPQGKWSCFEWNIAASGGKGPVKLYLDGTEVPGTAINSATIPHVDKTRLGIQRYGGGVAGELWYDDYAVGAARIGCN